MSAPRIINITRTRGDTYSWDYEIGADLTGYTVLLTVDPEQSPETDANNLFQLTGSLIGVVDGVSTVRFGPLTTEQADQTPATYYYDIEATSGGNIRTFVKGEYVIEQDITK